MGLTNENLSTIPNCYKYNIQILNIINSYKIKKIENKPKQKKEIRKILSKIKKYALPPISNDIVQLFYENPKDFFSSYEKLIEHTSFYDDCGNSIFVHYFYVLSDSYNNKSIKITDDIYEKNFQNFFKKEAKYLSIQDFSLETPLHKLAKLRDKQVFLKICEKLKDINVLNEELLSINNLNKESCFDYILQEVKINKNKIIENNFEFYHNFFNYFPNLIKSLSLEDQKLIITFSCLITFTEKKLDEINFDDAIKSMINLKEKNSDILNIFEFLYYPNSSGINYLNYLFHSCKNSLDFDKLFQFVFEISQMEIKDTFFKKYCLSDHISYVLRNMNSKKYKGDYEINYGIQLINKIIPLLIEDESDNNIIKIISLRKKFNKKKIIIKNIGICNSLIDNGYLPLEKKCESLILLKEILGQYFYDITYTDFILDILDFYPIIDDLKKNIIKETNINSMIEDIIFVHGISGRFKIIERLYIKLYIKLKELKQINVDDYYSELKEFFINNCLKIFWKYKTKYNLPNEIIQKITKLIIAYIEHNFTNYIEKNASKDSNNIYTRQN